MTGRKKNQIFGKYGIVPPLKRWEEHHIKNEVNFPHKLSEY